jgi:hypothetical protein
MSERVPVGHPTIGADTHQRPLRIEYDGTDRHVIRGEGEGCLLQRE